MSASGGQRSEVALGTIEEFDAVRPGARLGEGRSSGEREAADRSDEPMAHAGGQGGGVPYPPAQWSRGPYMLIEESNERSGVGWTPVARGDVGARRGAASWLDREEEGGMETVVAAPPRCWLCSTGRSSSYRARVSSRRIGTRPGPMRWHCPVNFVKSRVRLFVRRNFWEKQLSLYY